MSFNYNLSYLPSRNRLRNRVGSSTDQELRNIHGSTSQSNNNNGNNDDAQQRESLDSAATTGSSGGSQLMKQQLIGNGSSNAFIVSSSSSSKSIKIYIDDLERNSNLSRQNSTKK